MKAKVVKIGKEIRKGCDWFTMCRNLTSCGYKTNEGKGSVVERNLEFSMEDLTRRGRMGELNLASRRAEEAELPSAHLAVYGKIRDRHFVAFLAVEELKLPNFEASVFERENLEEGSSTKVVDCILALKDYHEWKQMTAGRIHARSPALVSYDSSRQLDMSGGSNKPMPSASDIRKLEGTIVKALAEHMVDTKENMDNNLFASYRSGSVDSVNFFSKILSSCLEEQFRRKFPEMKLSLLDHLKERSCSPVHSKFVPLADLSNLETTRACLKKGNCNHWNLVEQQERELLNIKLLLSSAKQEVESLQSQLQSDLKQLGDQVLEMSSAALGYHKAVKENRNLYNMVQDLKGNIRVYCRIRPALNPEVQNVIDFVGKEGSLVVIDPKPLKDGKKIFQFNRVFGPTATQDEVFRDTQPLVRSVMDGYNVCIFAYGQTGSGKTHTMYGPPGGSAKELGISYLALNDLFGLSDQRKDITKYEIQVQMVEIYNEQVVKTALGKNEQMHCFLFVIYAFARVGFLTISKLEIQSCVSNNNNLALPDATLHPVKSTVDVINLMKLSEVNRAVGSSAINIRSSRSHSILSVHVQGEDASGSILRSCLHLVDLADVITALAQKNSHIPYRNSKLTLLLQNSLGGNAKTLMFAHVNPEQDLNCRTWCSSCNKESSEVLELKAQIESLKKALGNKEAQTPLTKKMKEAARTPFEKPKQMTERTPPRTRRLSIENGNTMALERSINYDDKRRAKTLLRLSIENGITMPLERSINYDDKRRAKTPSVKPKQLTEQTPPRSRRLSIENGITMPLERSTNHDDKREPRPLLQKLALED
ncbi:hypothetical protein Pfo_028261 [Paulownia fortunei]|nr:hypothetical protein Pfo_028261 [Paulownia fortunei]